MKIVNDFNLKKQAEYLDVKIWQTPNFVFIIMGFVTMAVMTATYFVSKGYSDPRILIISETIVVVIILIAGTSIARMVEQVVYLNKMKSEFVSVASHQLRTPISAIKWESELLLSKYKKGLNKKQLRNIENISKLSQKMIKLVNDLLDVARIDQDRLVMRNKKVNLNEIVQTIISESKLLFESRNIELVFNVKKKLPLVFVDPYKIKLVIENLVNNAFKYTTNGGKVEVNLRLKTKGCFLIFEIKDNGVGIPADQIKNIFQKFFRSSNAVKYQTEGTGLGLYIAKSIVEQLGGKIWFKSTENVGSIFSFSVPVFKK